jgi:hypothetical protein
MIWVQFFELPLALCGFWFLWTLTHHLVSEARAAWKEVRCERHGGHALKATRWYACRACGYEATYEEARIEIAREQARGAEFVILKPTGGR